MNILFLLLTLSSMTYAGYSKPELVARLDDLHAWNAPDNLSCYSSSPSFQNGLIYLGCRDNKSFLMAAWGPRGFKVIERSGDETIFSSPLASMGTISWYEFNELTMLRSFVRLESTNQTVISNLDSLSGANDSFLPLSIDSFFYRAKGETPELMQWTNGRLRSFFAPGAAYLFTPIVGASGEVALKTRDQHLGEEAPDRLWIYDGNWKMILEDQDANPSSPWKTFRHQLSVEGDKVLAIATDKEGEALILIQGSRVSVLARAKVDLLRFDFFAPKMRAETIVVRGEDFQKRKAIYVYDKNGFRKLVAQGDIVHTDITYGRIDYQNQDAIFYGSPAIDERGNIVFQATLTHSDHPRTLLGIGLIKINKE